MLFFILKLILVFVLTLIPIFFGLYVKPKQDTSDRCRNLFTFIESYMPFIKSCSSKLFKKLKALWSKMQRTENGRKFFTCLVIILLLAIQYIDFQSTSEVTEVCKNAMLRHTEQKFITATPNTTEAMVFGIKSFYNYWYPYITPLITYVVAMVTTLALFSDKLAGVIFKNISGKRYVTIITIEMIWILAVIDEGRNFLLSETLIVLLIAGMIYPGRKSNIHPKGGTTVDIESSYKQKEAA